MRTRTVLLFLVLASLPLVFTNCDKDDEDTFLYYDFKPLTEDFMRIYSAHNHAYFKIDAIFSSLIDSLNNHPSGTYQFEDMEVTITPPDTFSFPKNFEISFIPSRADTVSGSLEGSISDHYTTPGCLLVVDFIDYVYNSYVIEGRDSIKYLTAPLDPPTYELNSTNGRMYPQGSRSSDTSLFSYNQLVEMHYANDAFMKIPGGSAEIVKDSSSAILWVSENYPLLRDFDCDYFKDGVLKCSVFDHNQDLIGEGSLDYGYPDMISCDNKVYIVIQASTYYLEYVYEI